MSKVTHKKKKSDLGIPKFFKAEGGIPRIPKTFVFDQNLPKEEYLKYINPDNIIPESLEVATKVFSSYRKKVGGPNMDSLSQSEFPRILKHKSSLPFFDHNKTSAREYASHRDGAPSYEASVMHDAKQFAKKKTLEKSKHDEIIQESMMDFKGMASFSGSQDHRNQDNSDGHQTSPKRGKGSLRNGEDSMNQSKVLNALNASGKPNRRSQEKEGLAVIEENLGKENSKKNQHKRSESENVQKVVTQRKKKAEDKYEISDLDNTQEIVRKTDVAVRTLSKRSEQVKREMKNFEENVKAQLKENESAPISSLRAVNLVRDFVFNEEEFARLIEEEDQEDEREKAQREYNERKRITKKKMNSSRQAESKVKALNSALSARFNRNSSPKTSPRNDAIKITKEEKKSVEQIIEKQVAVREEELKKQVEVQFRIHEKYGVFSNENNLFRIHSMNYSKLMREKEKSREHLLLQLKISKYKEREAKMSTAQSHRAKMSTAQSHRARSIHSERQSQPDLDFGNEDKDKDKGAEQKEDSKSQYLHRLQEVLTKPVKDTVGNNDDFGTHVKRLGDLRKKFDTTGIERVNQATFHNL